MSRLPRLRNRLPLRRRVWKARRARARAHRAGLRAFLDLSCRAGLRLPAVAAQSASHRRSRPRRARVAFFAGCIANVAFARLNESTIRVLTSNGCEVVVPQGQLCCGALSAHAGIRDVARELAGTNLAVFLRENFDA